MPQVKNQLPVLHPFDYRCDEPWEYIPNFIEVTDSVIDSAEPQDVIITLGAGDVSSLAPIIVDGLSRRFG